MKLLTSLILVVVVQGAFAQIPKTIYEQDTIPNTKLVAVDSNLVFPKLKYPISLCDSMENIYTGYKLEHKEAFSNKNSEKNNNHNYYTHFWFSIDKSGKVLDLKPKKFYSKSDSILFKLFAPLLRRSQWVPFYRKNNKSRIYLDTKAIIYFGMDNNKISLLQIIELNTGNSFFECSNNSKK